MSSQPHSAPALGVDPCPQLLHGRHYLSSGYNLSISEGQYEFLSRGYSIRDVQTVFETRHQRLSMLVSQYGSVAELNRAIGRESNWARLYQIYNRSIRSDRGTPFVMGEDTAREIEQKLSLQEGWMDTPPTYREIHGIEDPKAKAILLLEQMTPEQALVATRLLTAIAEPEEKQGNGG